jgi:hypothetical protein
VIAAWFSVILLAGHLTVTSASDCPSASDIDGNLAVLLPEQTALAGTVAVSPTEAGLLVDLRPSSLAFTGQRLVVVGSNCQERAKAVAVVIATWWPVGPAGARPLASAGARQEARSRRLGLAAGGYASIVSSSVAPGARVEASFTPRGQGFGVRLAAGGTFAHDDSLAQGRVSWSRASLEFGPTYSHRFLTLDASVVGSLLWVGGSGFSENRQASGAAAGFTVGLRAAIPWGRVQPWLEVRGIAWPQSQEMDVTDAATGEQSSRPLSHVELQLGAGIAFSIL